MKIYVEKPDVNNLDNLRQQLVSLQDRINNAFMQVGYGQASVLTITTRPTELPKTIPTSLTSPAKGMQLIYLRNLTDDATYPTNPPYVNWIPEGKGITLRAITGLTSTSLYELRFLIYGG